jgi:hypothetical protein
MSYRSTVIALLPLGYWPLDELANGTFADISGNGETGTHDALAAFGFPGAIETESSSATSGPVGNVPAGIGEPLDIRDNFTWLFWVFYDPTNPSAHVINRRGQWGIGNSVQAGINNDQIVAHLSLVPDNPFTLTAAATLVPNTWYFVAVVRNAAVFSIYVNASLAQGATRSDLTAAEVDYNVNGNAWFVGRSINTTAFSSKASAHVAIFDYALNAAQVLVVYEAALNQLRLAGRSDVVVTAVLSSLADPDPVSFPWRWNWSDIPVERIVFQTAVASSVTAAEEANSQRVAPRRELEFTQLLRNHTERRKLRAQLWAKQHAPWFIPVRQDAQQLTVVVNASATTIPVSTLYRDYEVGQRIGLRQVADNGTITHWEEQVITAVNIDSVACAPLTNSYAPYLSWVYPVRRAYLPPSINIKPHTDAVEELTVTARLLPEDEAVVPNRIIPWTPTIKYRDYEVWDISLWPTNDWGDRDDYEVSRETMDVDFGIGLLGVESDTAGASETLPWRIKTKGRETIARLLGWFYERRGRARYVWVPTLQADFDVLSVDGVDLTVADTNYGDTFALAEARRDLAFVYYDGTMEFRRVVGFSGTTNETLELDAPVPTLTSLRMVSLLKFCRLDADQVEIAWHTDDVVEIAWAFREMLHTPEGTGVSSLSPSASMSVSLSPSGSPSPSSSVSLSRSPSASLSPSGSLSPSASVSSSPSVSTSASSSPSPSPSSSASPSA